jgi:ABC-type transport system substrate-binding protein
VGIDLQVLKMPSANWLDYCRAYKHDICDAPGANFDPDELRNRFHTKAIGAVNYAGLSDAKLDDLLVKGQLAPLGSDARRQIYADAQRRMMEIQVTIAMVSVVRTYAMANRLRGPVVGHPTGVNLYPPTDEWLDS